MAVTNKMHHSMVVCLMALLFVVPEWGYSQSNNPQSIKVFETPPSPHELADILFPPRPRAILIDDGSDRKSQPPRLFGMQINFEFGKVTIVPESRPFLDSVGEMLNLVGLTEEAIVIEGHTDAVGGDSFNQTLSEKRALAVKRYLISVHGIAADRLHALGKGEQDLLNAQDPLDAINRRVQFKPLDRKGNG